MPFTLALLGSMLVHLGALFGTEWALPGLSEQQNPPVVDAVLLPPLATVTIVVPGNKAAPPKPAPRKVAARASGDAVLPAPTIVSTPASIPASIPAAESQPLVTIPPDPVASTSTPPDVQATEVQVTEVMPEPSASAPAAISLVAKGRLRYAVIRGEQGFVVGQSVHEWEHDGSRYRIQSVTETTGLAAIFKPARVVQSSQGLIDAKGLQPVEFRHEKVKGVDAATFDWATRKVRYEDKEAILPDGAQDMLSLYYQAALAVAPGQPVELAVATGRKLDRYRFEPKGEEVINVAGKDWPVLRLAAKSGPDVIELWISPELRNLPLKIRFVDHKGEIFDQIAETTDIKETP